ncbi:endo-1,3;1,4-beta-D-glucanase-like [Amaranthus tricolor]|uniref:endo-1,3;1,4-beta-D-glucanase-like n=1 Tax=Amaranthus tricolor TaxID=29722 RepID=UPI00258B0A81|nr:endo-1,3;1,4-beta-D-glucanase-like [Amaranthus tricolor]
MAGTQCCENPPALDSTSGVGHVEEIGGLKSYVSAISSSSIAVILISDMFGYEAPKLRKLADKVAAAGYYAVVPDFFHGDPYNPEDKNRPIQVWIKDHGPVSLCSYSLLVKKISCETDLFMRTKEDPSVIHLETQKAHTKHYLKRKSNITAKFLYIGLKVPVVILGGENDQISPPELLKKFSEILRSKPEVDSFVKIFPAVAHGWAMRYDENDVVAVKAAEEAHQDMLAWFNKYIKMLVRDE